MKERCKIKFVYKDDGEYKTESLWAEKMGIHYVIDNIPFYIKNIAIGDIVSVEVDNNELFFDKLIKASGHSTIQIVFFEKNNAPGVLKKIEEFGCKWEGLNDDYFSIDVPLNVNYAAVIEFLKSNKTLDYHEACIG